MNRGCWIVWKMPWWNWQAGRLATSFKPHFQLPFEHNNYSSLGPLIRGRAEPINNHLASLDVRGTFSDIVNLESESHIWRQIILNTSILPTLRWVGYTSTTRNLVRCRRHVYTMWLKVSTMHITPQGPHLYNLNGHPVALEQSCYNHWAKSWISFCKICVQRMKKIPNSLINFLHLFTHESAEGIQTLV